LPYQGILAVDLFFTGEGILLFAESKELKIKYAGVDLQYWLVSASWIQEDGYSG
jgi:hypothetical protein